MEGKAKKILLVDNVKLFMEMEKTLLSRKGLTIFTASSGKEVLAIHRKEKVDLILLDLFMPEMGGDKVCRRIREDRELRDVSIIIVTPGSKEEGIKLCQNAGANDYVAKPIDPKVLLSKISRLLDIPERKDVRVLVRIGLEGGGRGIQFFGNSVDISLGGMLVEVDRPITVGERINLSLVLPHRTRLLKVKGNIVRQARGDEGMYRYGVKFEDLGWEEMALLKELIDSKRS